MPANMGTIVLFGTLSELTKADNADITQLKTCAWFSYYKVCGVSSVLVRAVILGKVNLITKGSRV